MAEILLFLTAIALGMVLRGLYLCLGLIEKYSRVKALRYITDVIWCAVAFLAFAALTMYLGGGVFKTFTLLGILAGLGIASLIFGSLFKTNKEN